MTDVIERAAQALCALKLDGDIIWDMQDELAKEVYRKGARVVIEAMREPTDAMCEAGYSAGTGDWGGRYDNRRELARGRIEPGWQAMIDAALSRLP